MQITTDCSNPSGVFTNISIIQGETVALAITLSNNGTAINLTGYSFKSTYNFPTPLELTTGNNGITITSAALGEIQVNMASSITAAFESGSVPYDLWMIAPNGAETPLLLGSFSVTPSISPVP